MRSLFFRCLSGESCLARSVSTLAVFGKSVPSFIQQLDQVDVEIPGMVEVLPILLRLVPFHQEHEQTVTALLNGPDHFPLVIKRLLDALDGSTPGLCEQSVTGPRAGLLRMVFGILRLS